MFKEKSVERLIAISAFLIFLLFSISGSPLFKRGYIENVIKDGNYTVAMIYEEPTDDWKVVEADRVQKETDNFRFVNGNVSQGKTTYFYKGRIINLKKTEFYSPSELAKINKESTCYIIQPKDKSVHQVCKTDVTKELFKIVDKTIKDLKIKLVDSNKK